MNDREMRIALRLAGVITASVVLIYPLLPWLLSWQADMAQVQDATSRVFWIHNGFVVMLMVLQTLLLFGWPDILLKPTQAGLALGIAMMCMWAYKLITQFFYLPMPAATPTQFMVLFWLPLIPAALATGIFLAVCARQYKALHHAHNHANASHHHRLTDLMDV